MDTVVEFENSIRYPNSRMLYQDLERRFLKTYTDEDDADIRPYFNQKGEIVEVVGTRRTMQDDWTVVTTESIEIENLRPMRRRTCELQFQTFWLI